MKVGGREASGIPGFSGSKVQDITVAGHVILTISAHRVAGAGSPFLVFVTFETFKFGRVRLFQRVFFPEAVTPVTGPDIPGYGMLRIIRDHGEFFSGDGKEQEQDTEDNGQKDNILLHDRILPYIPPRPHP